ncbi:sulfur carrier protein ThiS [Bacillus sp. JCM 19046]|nr:sulfur carrier protein ThiS [Bacillus sp. JCM 19045]GAF19369.1 sulfur carrier protein ThiS [Bacillus sp. JCM 19046]
MILYVNGKEHTVSSVTLDELIVEFELTKQLVVTEVDGVIVDREHWDSLTLKDGMKIELVHFVGGG